MARILVFSNAPGFGFSGYSGQADQLVQSLTELGHDVDVLASHGFYGGAFPLETGGVLYGRGGQGLHGEDRFAVLIATKTYDVVITLLNAWGLDGEMWSKLREARGFQLYSIDPIERYPMTKLHKQWYEKSGSTLIPLTQFAAEEADRNGLKRTGIIPHTVHEAFVDEGDAPKERFRLPTDRPIIGIVGANSGAQQGWIRKSFDTLFLAVKDLVTNTKHKDALVWVHANPTESHTGTDLFHLARQCGLGPKHVLFPPLQTVYHPLSTEDLAKAYRCMDIFVHASKAEGFGVCGIEAQACGVPVIGTKSRLTPGMTYLGSELKYLNTMYDTSQYGFVDVPSPIELRHHIARLLDKPPKELVRKQKAAEVRRDFSRVRIRDECWKPLFEDVPEAVTNLKKLPNNEESWWDAT